ncbi:DUF1672 domain-containing protein [Halobacillus litoralis]|uniref:DUF1672 family protein n=1 Tax=Halobacillus litoralis TaxID=45668 RepID=UPI001CD214A6|nr:DUF1672 family protein [Halobacillus litoralis]MCA0970746.1 DUF1672 domain-containing protein [Halobacillus litoralis]
MKITYRILTGILVGSLFLLGGCSALTQSEDSQNTNPENTQTEETNESSDYIPVQDYTGQGYDLPNGEKADNIAENHSEEIEKAVVDYFKEEYKTDVEVHNMVGAEDGVSVFVESKGKPHFYSFAIVPIDSSNQEVLTDEVWSQEYQVEQAIMSGLYAWIKEEEFTALDQYFKKFQKNHPVVGKNIAALENVGGSYYMTPYYHVPIAGGKLEELLNQYLTDSNLSKEEWSELLGEEGINPDMVNITIQLHMDESNVEPDEEIFNEMVNDIKSMEGIPAGTYSVLLHDNQIRKSSGQNNKPNSLQKSFPDPIIKK